MTDEDAARMRREYVEDLVATHRETLLRLGNVESPVLGWVRAVEWKHRPSDDFEGCTE